MERVTRFLFFVLLVPALSWAQPYLGIDVLAQKGFAPLLGKRVGLLTHAAGVNRNGTPTWEILHKSSFVDLVALYAPEHGIDGKTPASAYVESSKHRETGLMVHSLYGATRKPTEAMLAGIEVMAIDLQDIGVRSYTFVSAMKLAMEACFAEGIDVVVLDRPNPLGGNVVNGPMLDTSLVSYVGPFQVPYVHGLTIGELALAARNTPGWLEVPEEVRRSGRLVVVPMRGWKRDMLWSDTGLEWIPTSPFIPDLGAAMGYAMTGLGCQIGGFSHGLRTDFPFRLLSHPATKPDRLALWLNSLDLPGMRFVDLSSRGIEGVYVVVEDWAQTRPVELSMHLMRAAAILNPENPFAEVEGNRADLFNKHTGDGRWWAELQAKGDDADISSFLLRWRSSAVDFEKWSEPFRIY